MRPLLQRFFQCFGASVLPRMGCLYSLLSRSSPLSRLFQSLNALALNASSLLSRFMHDMFNRHGATSSHCYHILNTSVTIVIILYPYCYYLSSKSFCYHIILLVVLKLSYFIPIVTISIRSNVAIEMFCSAARGHGVCAGRS